MFVLLGIIILIASFVIAIISLVMEQKKIDEAQKEPLDVGTGDQDTQNGQLGKADASEAAVPSVHKEDAKKRLFELVKKQKEASATQEPVETTEREELEKIFNGSQTVNRGVADVSEEIGRGSNEPSILDQSQADIFTAGDQTQDSKFQQSGPLDSFDDSTQASSDNSGTLSGKIDMQKIAKAKKDEKV